MHVLGLISYWPGPMPGCYADLVAVLLMPICYANLVAVLLMPGCYADPVAVISYLPGPGCYADLVVVSLGFWVSVQRSNVVHVPKICSFVLVSACSCIPAVF